MSESPRPDRKHGELLHSDLADDPDMLDLVESFVEQLPIRAAAMSAAFDAEDAEKLKVLAHQLKGAAGSYGFTPISEACKDLEAHVLGDSPRREVGTSLSAVVDLCSRATSLPRP